MDDKQCQSDAEDVEDSSLDITASHLTSALSKGRMEEGFGALPPDHVPDLELGY